MDDTSVIDNDVGTLRSTVRAGWSGTWSGVSWSAVIAGALTAIAVTIIVVALGSGIGFVLISPYSPGPSAGTMTIIGALWLVFAQAIGFATGGYVAGRLRGAPTSTHSTEVQFRDGANGLVVWAIGVAVGFLLIAAALDKAGSAAGTAATTTAGLGVAGATGQSPSIDYFTDILLRRSPQNAANAGGPANTAAAGAAPNATSPNGTSPTDYAAQQQHAQINRILLMALTPSGVSDDDRTYLAQLVSAETGMSQDDARHRVDDVVNKAKQGATQAADSARKAAAYLSFWTFMSLLFGAVCATLGGVLGGDLRDEYAIREAVPTSPR